MKPKNKIKPFITVLLLISFVALPAQNRRGRPSVEKMHEHKWQIIISQVKLTNEEAAAVKPIFMEYEQAVWKIHKERINTVKNFRKNKSAKLDYNALNDRYINSEIKQAQLLREYHLKLKKVLNPETLFNYYQAERNFKRKLLRDMPPPPPDEKDEN